MRRFRGKAVIGWKTVTATNKKEFDEKVNELMDEYDFEDYQFSTTRYMPLKKNLPCVHYSASILLVAKE